MAEKSYNPDLISGFAIILIFLGFSYTGLSPFDAAERAIYDVQMKLVQDEPWGVPEIALIEIDDRSVDEFGSWPWPRRMIAEMIDILESSGAKLIGINLPLVDRESNQGPEEARKFRERFSADPVSSKDALLTAWILENTKLMEERLDNDSRLVDSVRKSGKVILPAFCRFGVQRRVDKKKNPSLLKNTLSSHGISESQRKKISVTGLSVPFPELASAAMGLGHVSLTPDQNMAGRSHALVVNYRGSLIPSFPLRLAIAYSDQKPKEVLVTRDHIRLKDYSIPINNGAMLIRFRNPQAIFSRYSFADVLNAKRVPSLLQGRIVLLSLKKGNSRGFNGPGSSNMPEDEFIAGVLDNIIRRDFVMHPPFASYIQILAFFFLGGIASFFSPRLGGLSRSALVFGLAALTLVTGAVMFAMMGLWFKTAHIAGCLVTIYLSISARKLLSRERLTEESIEAYRTLGLSFQSQGLLDRAFDKFKRLPAEKETKELIYNLGIEFERRGMADKALSAFQYINKKGGFRDLDNRIPRLKESYENTTLGIRGEAPEAGHLAKSTDCSLRVGRYEITGELGRGSMGRVYRALDPKINRVVAIKTIRFSDEFDDDVIEEIKERFFREAELAGQLSHPAIVTVFDVGEDHDLTYMAMECLEGASLERFTKKKTLLPFRKVLDVVAEVAEALEFAHQNQVIHRDIKPANIMLLKDGRIKVTDFGIAKAVSSSRTKTGVVLGTPSYMSPEQIMGKKIDGRSDIFSLGILFFQLLTGDLPFRGKNMSGLLHQITRQKHPPVRRYNPSIPKACEQIIDRALAKDANDRMKTPGQMAKYIRVLAGRIDRLKAAKPTKQEPLFEA